MDHTLKTGVTTVAISGTAVQLSTTSVKASSVTLQASGRDGIIVGDENVKWATDDSAQGILVSDGTGSAFPDVQRIVLDSSSAADLGMRGISGHGYYDLSKIWVDAESNLDKVSWTAVVVPT